MKLLVGTDIGSYTFTPGPAGEGMVSMLSMPVDMQQEALLLIVDVTAGVVLYDFSNPDLGAVGFDVDMTDDSDDQLPLDVDVTLKVDTSSLQATDRLQIWVNVPLEPTDQIPVGVMPAVPGRQPASVGMPVTITNEQINDFQGQTTTFYNPGINTILAFQDCLQYRSAIVEMIGSALTAGAMVCEGSNTGQSWSTLVFYDATANYFNTGINTMNIANGAKVYRVPLEMRYFRIRVSVAVTGVNALVATNVVYRMTPTSLPFASNVTQFGSQNVVTGGVNGVQSFGGNTAANAAYTAYPLGVAGVDGSALARRFLTDATGQQIMVGPDAARALTSRTLITTEADEQAGRYSQAEVLQLILAQLKTISFYLSEMPLLLNQANGSFEESVDDFYSPTNSFATAEQGE